MAGHTRRHIWAIPVALAVPVCQPSQLAFILLVMTLAFGLLAASRRRGALAILLFATIALAALGGNAYDVAAVRYLIPTWHAAAVVGGVAIARWSYHCLALGVAALLL